VTKTRPGVHDRCQKWREVWFLKCSWNYSSMVLTVIMSCICRTVHTLNSS